jgi:hypothetical protein
MMLEQREVRMVVKVVEAMGEKDVVCSVGDYR